MGSTSTLRKPLGIRATPEEHERITLAAQREHRSVNSFVLRAALQAADGQTQPKPKHTIEQVRTIVEAARAAVREANPDNRDILSEFLAERREAGARGE
jgi:hypothetical protein